jgi:hypothetical protein
VPAQISNNIFWARYFFKVSQLEEEHRKRVKFLERAVVATDGEQEAAEAEQDWGSDDEDDEKKTTTTVAEVASSTLEKEAANDEDEKEEDENDKTPVFNEEENPDQKELQAESLATEDAAQAIVKESAENMAGEEEPVADEVAKVEKKMVASLRPEDSELNYLHFFKQLVKYFF